MATVKKTIRTVLIVIAALFVGIVCFAMIKALPILALILVSIPDSQPIAAPKVFPEADILYVGGEGLGFISADGSGQETFPFRAQGRSVLSEGMEIYFITGDHRTLIPVEIFYGRGTYEGRIYTARPGEIAVECGWWVGIAQLTPDQQHIWVGTEQDQAKYRLTDCGTGKPPERVILGAGGVLSPDERYSVDAQYSWSEEDGNKYSLILYDIGNGETRVIGEGNFPAWSHDGQWLAYTGRDGIYIIRTGFQEEPRRVVAMEKPIVNIPVYDSDRYPPAVSWSPDAKWLVYHVPKEDTKNAKYLYDCYSIFKVNVETGETIMLLDNALFPYWIWPVKEP